MRLPEQYSQGSGPHRDHGTGRRALPVLSGADSAPLNRRDFLTLAGFAVAGAAVAGCQRASVHYAETYIDPPAGLIPGRSYDYASTCGGCSAGCGLLVRNRDGRPIKLEGNPDHPLSRGGLCAAGQASLLGLYDQQRLATPLVGRKPSEWQDVDQEVVRQLEAIRRTKGAVRFLTGPGVSPAVRASIRRFLDGFADARHVVHDPRSCSAILEAHARTHGARLLPHYHLDKAEVIVGLDADFLGAWISPVEFTAAYQAGRPRGEDGRFEEGRFSYHVQFESLLTLTGSKADQRLCVAPEELGTVMGHLAARLAKLAQKPDLAPPISSLPEPPVSGNFLDKLAASLWQHRQRSVVLCGSQDVDLQARANVLNHLLDNYGATVDLDQPSYQRDGDDGELETLLHELHDPASKIQALFVYQSNPVHDLPGGETIAEDLKRVPLLVSLAPRRDETAELATFVCPDHHYLESWSDAEPASGTASLVQPTISPLGDTRSVLASLAAWTGKPRPAYDVLREHWEKEVFPRSTRKVGFAEFWDRTLLDGFALVAPAPGRVPAFTPPPAVAAASPRDEAAYTVVLYSKVGLPDSSHAYNPWLQELPDPISKVVWDNYATVSPATAEKLGVANGDLLQLETGGDAEPSGVLKLPVYVQAGQHDRVVGAALGYGSVLSKRFANIGPSWLQAGPTVGPIGLVGKNAAPLLQWVASGLHYTHGGVRLSKAAGQQPLALTQTTNLLNLPSRFASPDLEPQPIIRQATLQALRQEAADKPGAAVEAGSPDQTSRGEDLWPEDHPDKGARWGMAIDLSACTGCSACVIACQAENNIPVVGKDEVRRQRDMHWLRIDRYYTEHDGGVDVAYQPMLCQHCGNAPCEVVCPVLATVHSEEGLNEQVYNRCVGTRYCANNCPYKVRRFNWFDYAHDDLLQNLVLNPDVTVRSRGVMEKCSFCVQRIEEGKAAAGGTERFRATE
jgi:molybdopterin-containing oxidoreductase family iron-sulfur binding subunit